MYNLHIMVEKPLPVYSFHNLSISKRILLGQNIFTCSVLTCYIFLSLQVLHFLCVSFFNSFIEIVFTYCTVNSVTFSKFAITTIDFRTFSSPQKEKETFVIPPCAPIPSILNSY